MRSHSVTCHPAEVTFPPLPQPKLVLDLATPEGCKAELTWEVQVQVTATRATRVSGPDFGLVDDVVVIIANQQHRDVSSSRRTVVSQHVGIGQPHRHHQLSRVHRNH